MDFAVIQIVVQLPDMASTACVNLDKLFKLSEPVSLSIKFSYLPV